MPLNNTFVSEYPDKTMGVLTRKRASVWCTVESVKTQAHETQVDVEKLQRNNNYTRKRTKSAW